MSRDGSNEGRATHLQCVDVPYRSEKVALKGESLA
jgi:hypothetical protein